jgi:F420-non-reducing hydrogenase iron-sulfur subunit
MENTDKKDRKIIVFACHYCAYSAADMAGSARIQYPASVRIIRTPCTGRLEIDFFLKAFENGIDGVLVAGCEEGSCHFRDGNLLAKRRVTNARTLLEEAGLEPERLRMVNVSAADAPHFVQYVTEMAETINKLGPARYRRVKEAEQTGAEK